MSHRMNVFTTAKGEAIANHWKNVTWSASPNWDSMAPWSMRFEPVPVMVAVPPIEEENAMPRSIAVARWRISSWLICLDVLLSWAIVAADRGSISAAVAVFDSHIERKPVITMKPHMIERPPSEVELVHRRSAVAMRPFNSYFSTALAIKIVLQQMTIPLEKYICDTLFASMTPSKGSTAIGVRPVMPIGTALFSHHVTMKVEHPITLDIGTLNPTACATTPIPPEIKLKSTLYHI